MLCRTGKHLLTGIGRTPAPVVLNRTTMIAMTSNGHPYLTSSRRSAQAGPSASLMPATSVKSTGVPFTLLEPLSTW